MQGLPFSISGVGDLLALFRCISCKYRFDADPSFGESMGAIGRVFHYGKVRGSWFEWGVDCLCVAGDVLGCATV